MEKKNHKQIQDEIISRYKIDLCDGTKCKRDWERTHAHIPLRRVCKWKRRNSTKSTFVLLHEVGHIVANKAGMARCQQEYSATVWALRMCRTYGLTVPRQLIIHYQRYIYRELDRDLRRGANRPTFEELAEIAGSLWIKE